MPDDNSKSKRLLSVPNPLRKKSSASKLRDAKALLDSNPELISDDAGNFHEQFGDLDQRVRETGSGSVLGSMRGLVDFKYAKTQRDLKSKVDDFSKRVQKRSDDLENDQAQIMSYPSQSSGSASVQYSLDSSGASIIPGFADPRDSFQSTSYAGHYASSERYSDEYNAAQTRPNRASHPASSTPAWSPYTHHPNHSSGSGHSARATNQYSQYGQSRDPVASPTFGVPAASSAAHSLGGTVQADRYIGGSALVTFTQSRVTQPVRRLIIWQDHQSHEDVYSDTSGRLACWVVAETGRGAWYSVTYRPARSA
ncbi:hypothetical protein AURDEDRAFT_141417 [Auricularia subglabra TFB-10046 SS5]|nr:hypothetical protein AURDEDRAFT_141417 [Auricularia subglabra TFB-10046 SS5]